jgi:hypothetical protein
MGSRTRYPKDKPRKDGGERFLEVVRELGSGIEASGGALASREEFCAREHTIHFRISDQRTHKVGEVVSLSAGDPLQVLAAAAVIGQAEAESTSGLDSCLAADWRVSGRITMLDAAGGKGVAVVKGEHEGDEQDGRTAAAS